MSVLQKPALMFLPPPNTQVHVRFHTHEHVSFHTCVHTCTHQVRPQTTVFPQDAGHYRACSPPGFEPRQDKGPTATTVPSSEPAQQVPREPTQ